MDGVSLGDGRTAVAVSEVRGVLVRTWAEGANKLEIALSEANGKVTCRTNNPIAREVGGGKMVTSSTPWVPKLEVLSSKQLSSACSVSKT